MKAILTAAFVTLLVLPSTVFAQETSLAGKVRDSTEGVLPGVVVTAVHVASGNSFVSVTDASGGYRIGAMRPGIYKVTADLSGFAPRVFESIELAVGQSLELNVMLALSTVQESVTVSGAAPLVETTRSTVATTVNPREVQELPINGRNWLQLSILSPGNRQTSNAIGDAPVAGAQGTDPGMYQLNMDGQQVTQTMAQSTFGQVRFSQDAVAEFQYVSSRFDATQGRSMGVQVNAVSKAGTNTLSGSASGFFRASRFNAPDFALKRVIPASDQNYSFSLGGPITQDRLHYFVNYEGVRTPRTVTFNTPYPSFNLADIPVVSTEHIGGVRLDWQASQSTRLMIRGSSWSRNEPNTSGGNTLTTSHPSVMSSRFQSHYELFVPLTTVLGNRTTNEFKPGFLYHTSDHFNLVPGAPRVTLRGFSLGGATNNPLLLILHTYTVRDDFTTLKANHEIKIGGEYIWQPSAYVWSVNRYGSLQANRGVPPAKLEELFPVWNDHTTWNLRPLSANAVRWQQSFGNWSWGHNQPNAGAYVQDNWAVNSDLTLNLGVRWDLSYNWTGNQYDYPPLRKKVGQEWFNLAPRLGFAYSLADDRTVIRGGWGRYYQGPKDQWAHHIPINMQIGVPSTPYDGRADFAVNPFNGPVPTFEQAKAAVQDVVGYIASDTNRTPFSWQTSIGLQRQLGDTMSVQADYVWNGSRRGQTTRNTNLNYDPVTGVNYPWTDISRRVWPNMGTTNQIFSEHDSDYHGLETMLTKRFSQSWSGSVAYTLGGEWDCTPSPVQNRFFVQPDLGGDCGLASGDYRHRLVASGIWALPFDFQVSTLFIYRSGSRSQETWGEDLRLRGTTSGRLRSDGTIIPRSAFVGDPQNTVDLKLTKRLPLGGRRVLEGTIESFNTFNRPEYSYNLDQASRNYLVRSSRGRPRSLQLGLRYRF